MDKNVHVLNDFIRSFLAGEIDGTTFEKKFTGLFDFEEFEEEQIKVNFFQEIRELLERYASDITDLTEYSQYYTDEKKLKEDILRLYKMG